MTGGGLQTLQCTDQRTRQTRRHRPGHDAEADAGATQGRNGAKLASARLRGSMVLSEGEPAWHVSEFVTGEASQHGSILPHTNLCHHCPSRTTQRELWP